MKGLRKDEGERFHRFFSLIQEEAEKKNSVFFADAGDGNDFETPTMEGENMMGWLIPFEKAEEFEPLWKTSTVDDSWTAFFLWAVWSMNTDNITITFEEY